MKTIGDRIKSLRKYECSMTQTEFAVRLGVTSAHISKIENGLTMPSEALIKLICKSFSVSEYWLKDGIEPIYVDQIINESDKNMVIATRENNKLLNNDNPLIQLTASKLQSMFASITNADKISQENKLTYLRTLLHLLNYINDTIDIFRQLSENDKMELTDEDLEALISLNMKSVETDFREIAKIWRVYK